MEFELLRLHYETDQSIATTQEIMETLKRPPFNVTGLPKSASSMLNSFRIKKDGPMQKRGGSPQLIKKIHCPILDLTAYLSYADLEELCVKIASNVRLASFWNWEPTTLVDSKGLREFGEFVTGMWFEKANIEMKLKFGDHIKVGAIFVSSDGINTTKNISKTLKKVRLKTSI